MADRAGPNMVGPATLVPDTLATSTVALDPTAEESITTITFAAPKSPTGSSIVHNRIVVPTIETVPNRLIVRAAFNITTAPITYSVESHDNPFINKTRSVITQSVTATRVSTTQEPITILSLTPAATSTASATGTSRVKSVGSKHTWSAILFLPWLAAVLSI